MSRQVISSVNAIEWAQHFSQCAPGSVYQDPRWLNLIESVYPRLKVHRLVCMEADNLSWLLPLVEIRPLGRRKPMMISLPFGNYGGFLLPVAGEKAVPTTESFDALKTFFDGTDAFALEIREIEPVGFSDNTSSEFVRFELLLPDDPEVLWKKSLTGNVRTCVRKADKQGVEVEFDLQRTSIAEFSNLNERHAGYHGTPVHSAKWYPKMVELFRDEVEINVARYEGEVVAAVFVLRYGKRAVLHAAISDPACRKVPAIDKLIWETLVRLVEQGGVEAFDYGRTRAEPGKLFYKKKWGARELPLYYSYLIKEGAVLPRIVPDNKRFKGPTTVWRHLPRAVQRIIGPVLRPRIPT